MGDVYGRQKGITLFFSCLCAILLISGCGGGGGGGGNNADPVLSFTSSLTLPDGVIGQPYNETIDIGGAVGALTVTLTSGSLPPGMTFRTGSIILEGTPTTAGDYEFTFGVSDESTPPQTVSGTFNMHMAELLGVATTSLPDGTVDSAYTQTLTANGGTPPFVWTLIEGTLPAGLSLDAASGAISGTPSAAETAAFTVQAEDSGNPAQLASAALQVSTVAVSTVPHELDGTWRGVAVLLNPPAPLGYSVAYGYEMGLSIGAVLPGTIGDFDILDETIAPPTSTNPAAFAGTVGLPLLNLQGTGIPLAYPVNASGTDSGIRLFRLFGTVSGGSAAGLNLLWAGPGSSPGGPVFASLSKDFIGTPPAVSAEDLIGGWNGFAYRFVGTGLQEIPNDQGFQLEATSGLDDLVLGGLPSNLFPPYDSVGVRVSLQFNVTPSNYAAFVGDVTFEDLGDPNNFQVAADPAVGLLSFDKGFFTIAIPDPDTSIGNGSTFPEEFIIYHFIKQQSF
jgi:hypothetical protein